MKGEPHGAPATRGIAQLLPGCLLVSIPFLLARFPPIADLPQQVAQIRLFLEAVTDPGSPYQIQWLSPNLLSYALLGGCWAFFSPENVGRLAMLGIGLLWVASLHFLARERQRPAEAATLASLLFFNHVIYWGFYSFAIGWPVFVLWFSLLSRTQKSFRWTEGLVFCAAAYLLYLAHALWFAAGLVWLVLRDFAFRVPIRIAFFRLASVSPVLLLAALWYPKLAESGFQSETHWVTLPWQRLSPRWMVDAGFGGLRGWVEPTLLILLAVWVIGAIVQRRRELPSKLDRELLLAGLLFSAFSFFLPNAHTNTLQLAERWFPCALMLLLLAFPAPSLRFSLQKVVAVGLALGFCAFTALTWKKIEAREFAGLQRTLEALPPSPSVVGLDFLHRSSIQKVRRPYIQTFAYSQVVKGGTLNFSFADFGSSMVVYAPRRRISWPGGLEWHPERIRPSDFRKFSHAIVGGDESIHAFFLDKPYVRPLTREGVWRLYETLRNEDDTAR